MKRFALFLTLIALFFLPIKASARDFVFPVKDGSIQIQTTETEARFIVSSIPGTAPSYHIHIYKKTSDERADVVEKKVFEKRISFKSGALSINQELFTVSGLTAGTYYLYIGESSLASGFDSVRISMLAKDTKAILFKEFTTEKLPEFVYTSKITIPTPSNRTTVIAGAITVTKPEGYTQFNDGYVGVKAKLYYGKDFNGEQAIKGLSVDTQGRVTGDIGVLKAPVDAYKTQSGGLENIGINGNGTYYYPLRELDASGVYWVRELFTLPNGTYSFSDAISFDAERGFIPQGSAAAQQLDDQTSYRLLAPLPGLSLIKDPQQCELDKKAELQKRGLADTPENRAKLSMVCDINGLITFGIKFLIGVTAVILVVRLMFEGYQYMVTDVPMLKAEAKSHFFNALIGLLLALSAYLILNSINPKLVKNTTNLAVVSLGTSFNISGALNSSFSARPVTINFDKEAYPAAKAAAAKTGVHESFILAIFDQETSAGKGGTGRCRWDDANAKMKEDDKRALQTILAELGKNINDTPVSCALGTGGYGGAIGYTQFLPTTWLSVKDRAKTALGHTPNPWNINDALMATGFYLKDLGGTSDMYNAACKYYSGSVCRDGRQPPNKFYGDSVVSKKNKYDEVIAQKKASGVIK